MQRLIPFIRRRVKDAGVEMLGLLPHWVGATADRISADGSTITGRARLSGDSHEREPYLWTSEKGYETLPPPPGESDLVGIFTTQLIVSDDGSAIVGGIDNRPFMWRKELGTRFVDEMLANEFGMAEELEGWKLIGIRMSDDGSVIAGDAINPDGIREPWLVRLSPVPEPNTSMLLLVAAAGLASSGLKPTLFSRQ